VLSSQEIHLILGDDKSVSAIYSQAFRSTEYYSLSIYATPSLLSF